MALASRRLVATSVTTLPAAIALVTSLSACSGPSASQSTSTPAPSAEVTETPSSTPASLTLSPDGLGDLRVGAPIDTVLFTFRPEYCRETYPSQEWSDQHAGEWLPTSALTAVPAQQRPPVEIFEGDGVLRIVQIETSDIRTADGIGLGSTADEVMAAYPSATTDQNGAVSDLVTVTGESGSLLMEIAAPRLSDDYWPADQVGRVVQLRSVLTSPELLRPISGSDGYSYCQL